MQPPAVFSIPTVRSFVPGKLRPWLYVLMVVIFQLASGGVYLACVNQMVAFIAGVFRMWATFECNSTIQLWITPKRDMAVFFCFIQLLVQGCIQFSGLASVYMAFLAQWQYSPIRHSPCANGVTGLCRSLGLFRSFSR